MGGSAPFIEAVRAWLRERHPRRDPDGPPPPEPYPDWTPSWPWDYLRRLYAWLDWGKVVLTLAEFDAADPALLDDLLVLGEKDAYYAELARRRLPDRDERLRGVLSRARPWNT